MLLNRGKDRRYVHKGLPNVGAVLQNQSIPQLIMGAVNPINLLNALFNLCEQQRARGDETLYLALTSIPTIKNLLKSYLNRLSEYINTFVASNFFAHVELKFVLQLLNFEHKEPIMTKSKLFNLTSRLLLCLSAEFVPNIEQLFRRFIFNKNYVEGTADMLESWCKFYLKQIVFPHIILMSSQDLTLSKYVTSPPVLTPDWPYYPLRIMFHHFATNTLDEFKKEYSGKCFSCTSMPGTQIQPYGCAFAFVLGKLHCSYFAKPAKRKTNNVEWHGSVLNLYQENREPHRQYYFWLR